ncbi:MAG: aromatic acid exporter family protein, partial [Youngiibacter sp.]|nr:aromatic acid exporter family protein [Youngiibacter sp.]
VAAGVITILSVQNTKKKSLDLAVMRIGSTLLALFIGAAAFSLLGYSAVAYGVYLMFFIPSAAALSFNDGIVPSSVLVTHLLLERSVSFSLLGNEVMLMVIGAGVGIILNIYMPNLEKQLNNDVVEIERLMKRVLSSMSVSLSTQTVPLDEEKLYRELDDKLKAGYERALKDAGNHLVKDVRYYLKYMEMRSVQFGIMKNMRKLFERLNESYEQTKLVAALTDLVADQFHESNTASELLEDLHGYKEIFRNMELPKSRDEFEVRAALFQYINELEQLLDVKREFVASLDDEDSLRFKTTLSESRN